MKNNIENFYGTLSLKKRNIVNGRYIFTLGTMIFLLYFLYYYDSWKCDFKTRLGV